MENKERLASLDILRGLDLWFLLMAGPLVHCIFRTAGPGSAFGTFVEHQFDHVAWEGFAAWDIIMPLFMFMSGITIPFSMSRYKHSMRPDKKFHLRLLKRFCVLFLLGWIVQGNLLAFDFRYFHPFANTLQAIAVGYLFSSLMFVHLRIKGQLIATALLFLTYFLAFVSTGMDLDPQTNIAMLVDKAVLGCHRDGVIWTDGGWIYDESYTYTWVLSSLNFIVTVMSGCFAGEIMLSGGMEADKGKALRLAAVGAALTAAGLLLGLYFPVIKRIWSSSMTLYSSGICFILMSICYYIIDVRKCRWKLDWIRYFGMNSIAAYVMGEFVDFSSVSSSFLYGLRPFLGEWYQIAVTLGNVLILFLILRYMYVKKVFIKI